MCIRDRLKTAKWFQKQHKKGVGFNQRPWRICRRFSHRCDKPYSSGLSDCKPSCTCAKIRLLLKDKRKNSHRQPHLRPLKWPVQGRMPHRRHPIYKRFHIRRNHMLYIWGRCCLLYTSMWLNVAWSPPCLHLLYRKDVYKRQSLSCII